MNKAIFLSLIFLTAGNLAAQAQNWRPVPLVTQAIRDAGHSGGEGAQWSRSIAADGTGRFVLYGTDVGGLFRSLDAGAHWEPCNVGYTPRGTAGLAIDPHNSRRCLSVGANSVAGDFNGMYLSTDGAASWSQVLKAHIAGSGDQRDQIAFDPQSFDARAGYTKTVYWSRIAQDKPGWGTADVHPALYKSEDGGRAWREVANTAQIGGSILRVSPKGGIVYAANSQGFYRSMDGGATWAQTGTGDCAGMDVSVAAPDAVWVSKTGGVWRSDDAGQAFAPIAGAGLPGGVPLINVKVSPVDARHMVLWANKGGYDWPRFYSADGGATWAESKIDNANAFLPYNSRQGLFAWSAKDADVAWSTGGDWPTKSADGGKTWKWSADGFNVVLVGGRFAFNAQNPNVLFVGSQDYNGAVTRDGGKTWTYVNPSGNGWGGFTYGGYAASSTVLYVGNASGWGGPRILTVSRDGGKTWTSTGLKYAGPDVSFGDPTDAKVLFASNLRSGDGGKTWQAMTGCEAVYGAGRQKLFGAMGNDIVASQDHGLTWAKVVTVPGGISDLACDPRQNRFYVASEGKLKKAAAGVVTTLDIPKDQFGSTRVDGVAVDPVDPDVVYAANHKDIYSASNSVVRSTDGGATWTILTRQAPLDGKGRDGGREAFCIRVHPKTREAWVATSCYGIWKIAPPAKSNH